MLSIIRRLACVVAATTVGAGCSERTPLASLTIPSPRSATDLPLVIPSGDLLATPRLDGRTIVTPFDSSRIPAGAGSGRQVTADGHTSTASTSDDWAIIRNQRSRAYFTQGNGVTVAGAEGSMDFFGTHGENHTTISVSTPSGSLLSASNTGKYSQPLPWWNTLVTHALLPLAGNCGYNALASTNHRAWQFILLPPFHTVGDAYEDSHSSPLPLPACPTGIDITNTGGEGDSRITDAQWQICYWLVWYDSNGVELWREFMYCTAL